MCNLTLNKILLTVYSIEVYQIKEESMTSKNLEEAIKLFIPDSNTIHSIVNGASDEMVPLPEGGEAPTVRKAFADSLLFKNPTLWDSGSTETDPLQLRTFTDGLIYWAPTAQLTNPIAMGVSPIGDSNWKIAPINVEELRNYLDLHNSDPNAHPELSAFIVSEADRAENAANNALSSAGVFETIQDGLLNTPEGGQFSVVTQDSLYRYKVVGGDAIFIFSSPTGKTISYLSRGFSEVSKGNFEFYNDETTSGFYVTDLENNTLLAINSEGLTDFQSTEEEAPQEGLVDFHQDDSDLSFVYLDDNGVFANPIKDECKKDTFMEFYNREEDDYSYAISDEEGSVGFFINTEGVGVVPSTEGGEKTSSKGLMGYSDGGKIYSTQNFGKEEFEYPQGYDVLSVEQGDKNSVRCLVKTSEDSLDSFSVGDGVAVKDSPKYLHVVIGLGQSLMVGSQSSESLISTESVYPELSLMFKRSDELSDVRNGLVTQDGEGAPELIGSDLVGFESLVAKVGQGAGSRGETPMESNANILVSKAMDADVEYRVLSFTAAMGGSSYNAIKKGTQTYTNMITALQKAKEFCEEKSWILVVDGCLVKHGEGNQSSFGYYENIVEWYNDINEDVKLITGQKDSIHFVFNQPSSHTTTTPRALKSMLQAHETLENVHVSGADYPYQEWYSPDNLHFLGQGYFLIGEQMGRAMVDCLFKLKKPKLIRMGEVTRLGKSVTVNYLDVEEGLALDTTNVPEKTNKGFRYFSDGVEQQIQSVTVTGLNTVVVELEETPVTGGVEILDYALRPQSSPRTNEARTGGNIRDSKEYLSGMNTLVYDWACHQEKEVVVL